MSFLGILDLVIGVIFIYFLLSLMASAILEIVANFGKFRANDLRDWVYSTFDKPFNYKKPSFFERTFGKDKIIESEPKCLGQEIWHHFTVDGLSKAGKKVSYIPSSEFVRALFDIIISVQYRTTDHEGKVVENYLDTDGNPVTKEDVQEHRNIVINKNPDSVGNEDAISKLRRATKVKVLSYKNYDKDELGFAVINTPYLSDEQKSIILQFIRESDSVPEVRKSLEVWFDHAMERLTGGYKRFSQRFLFFTGLLTALVMNVDTIELVQFLYRNPKISSEIADMAERAVNDPDYNSAVEKLAAIGTLTTADSSIINEAKREIKEQATLIKKANASLQAMHLPIGWSKNEGKSFWQKLSSLFIPPTKILGILITGFALSLGATFWFDLLNKLVNLRAAGKKPETTKEDEVTG